MMPDSDDSAVLSAEDGRQTVQATIHDARGAMYTVGSTAILLVWAGIISAAYLAQYAISTFAVDFADRWPWFPGPLWIGFSAVGMAGSMTIGYRAGRAMSTGTAMQSAGIRVFLYWMAVVTAAGLLPGAAGLWNETRAETIPYVLVGVIALGYVLFGILHKPVIAVFGLGYAVSFYVPHYIFDDIAPAISGIAMLGLLAATFVWVRRTGEW